MNIYFLDLETTGLDPYRHAITELALVPLEEGVVTHRWIDLTVGERGGADPQALRINDYYNRKHEFTIHPTTRVATIVDPADREALALRIAHLTDRCILAGNAIKFDQAFLEVWMRRYGAAPTWDYHVLDVPTFAAGVIHASPGMDHPDLTGPEYEQLIAPPFKGRNISELLGVEEPVDKHTALGDAQWSKRMYKKALEITR